MNSYDFDSVRRNMIDRSLASERVLFEKWFNTVLSDASDSVPRGGTSWAFAGGARNAAWSGWKAARGLYK